MSCTQLSISMHLSAKSFTLASDRIRVIVASWIARRWPRNASAVAVVPSDATPRAACSNISVFSSMSVSVTNSRVRDPLRLSSIACISTRVADADPLNSAFLVYGWSMNVRYRGT